jgi:DNA modification methylase
MLVGTSFTGDIRSSIKGPGLALGSSSISCSLYATANRLLKLTQEKSIHRSACLFKVQQIELSKLKPYPGNAKTHPQKQIDLLVKQIAEGFDQPIVVDKDYVIIKGHGRRMAALQMGLQTVPVIVRDDLTPQQVKAARIADNKLAETDWDMELLSQELEALNADGIDLGDIGFDQSELEVIFGGLQDDQDMGALGEPEEDDYEIPDEIQTDIVVGDLFEIGPHRLLCGDSTKSDNVVRLMNGQKVDMVFTDPPYGMCLDTDYARSMPKSRNGASPLKHDRVKGDGDDFTPQLITAIFNSFPYCKEVFIWGADYFAELIPFKNDGSWVVWDKRVDEAFDKMIGSAFELCWSKSKHQRKIARINNTLFSGEKDAQNKVHPTQKPIKLVKFFFDNWGKDCQLIGDLYLGSGTTMVAAHQLGRKCYGMELDPKYCQVIVERMLKLDGSLTIRKNGIDVTDSIKERL